MGCSCLPAEILVATKTDLGACQGMSCWSVVIATDTWFQDDEVAAVSLWLSAKQVSRRWLCRPASADICTCRLGNRLYQEVDDRSGAPTAYQSCKGEGQA